ncbi:MAG: magnesium/cobalt transporter CorA [Bacteroidia bacterium]|nr:magnesium/cobalt transporter CorA [Bacteroidia bacterium]MDW8235133.1 magnesium/cobalt transporter CorA [Bacteroidia bacterium]
MLRAYRFSPYRQARWLSQETFSPFDLSPYLWVDACELPPEWLKVIENYYGFKFPTRKEGAEIETSSRYHEDDEQIRISLRLMEVRLNHQTIELVEQNIALVWLQDKVFTLRNSESRIFQEFIRRLRSDPELTESPIQLMLAIFAQIVDADADNIELISQYINRISSQLHEANLEERQDIVLQLQRLQEFLILLREALFDVQRVLSLIIRSGKLGEKSREIVRILLKDISSLIEHISFSFQRLESIQNTILNLLNLEQNRIIRIFAVITVVFAPPTLIASIYGMNFKDMPELEWSYGYPLAWAMIIASSILTLWYFKIKKWL